MKKSKFTLVIVLGLVLCLLCGTTTTFSWFNRPDVQKGESLSWRGDYNVTNGEDITAVTYDASNLTAVSIILFRLILVVRQLFPPMKQNISVQR